MQSGRELKDYLLCQPCDNLLNENGENWVLPRLARIDGSFPLYEIIRKLPPDAVDGDSALYAVARNPEILSEKIIHYAMGVYFKAAVHPWRGGTTDPLIDLGKYTEPVRKFVKDGGPFPENMALVVGISPPPVHAIMFTLPYRGRAIDTHNFIFGVPGMQFSLLVGNGVSEEARRTSFAPGPLRPLLLTDELCDTKLDVARDASAKAHRSKKLLEYVKTSSHLKEYLKTRKKK